MAISSIHFRPVKSNSEAHNTRATDLDYTFDDLSQNNENWIQDKILDKEQEIKAVVKEKTGRAMQKKATPIREAVVNLNANHTIDDLKKLSDKLEQEKGIKCFQIHIHRDEGKSKDELNHHAHMVFDWVDRSTGKSQKLNRQDMSEIQTIVADSLGMERGDLKENTNRERLEAVEYKTQQEELKQEGLQTHIEELQTVVEELTEKKNDLQRDVTQLEAETAKPHKTLFGNLWQMVRDGLKKMKESLKMELMSLKNEYQSNDKRLAKLKTNTKKLKTITKELKKTTKTWKEQYSSNVGTLEHYEKISSDNEIKIGNTKNELRGLEKLLTPAEVIKLERPPEKNRGVGMGF